MSEQGERKRAVNKVRAGVRDRQDAQNRRAAADTPADPAPRRLLGKGSGKAIERNAPIFNPKADISGGIARRAVKGDPWENPDAYRPLPGAPTDANAGKPSRGLTPAKAREQVAARRYRSR